MDHQKVEWCCGKDYSGQNRDGWRAVVPNAAMLRTMHGISRLTEDLLAS
jgi:hypothetical protein